MAGLKFFGGNAPSARTKEMWRKMARAWPEFSPHIAPEEKDERHGADRASTTLGCTTDIRK